MLCSLATNLFSESFTRKDGSKIVFNDLLSSVIGKTGNLEKLGENLDSVEQKFLDQNEKCSAKKIDLEITVYTSKSKLIFEINTTNNIGFDERFYVSSPRLFYINTDMPYKYFHAVSDWFYGEHRGKTYYSDLNNLDPLYVFNYKNKNGKIQFQGVIQTSYYGSQLKMPVFFITCGSYEVRDSAEGVYGATKTLPHYNAVKSTYNAAYFVSYLFSDYQRIKDLPVPNGLDASFKNDFDKIPTYIDNNNWNLLTSMIKKYKLNFSYTISNDQSILDLLLKSNAQLSVYEAFSNNEDINYTKYIDLIIEKDAGLISFFYKFFTDSQKEAIIKKLQQVAPDKFFAFLQNENINPTELIASGIILNETLAKCSQENLIYATKSLETKDLLSLFPLLQDSPEKIQAIIKDRDDKYSRFVDYFYLSFNEYSSGEKVSQKQKSLDIFPDSFYLRTMYGNSETVFEKMAKSNLNELLDYLFSNGTFKLIIFDKNKLSVKCEAKYFDLTDRNDILSNNYIKKIIQDAKFNAAYDLFTNRIRPEDLFKSKVEFYNCSFSLHFEDSSAFDKNNKSGEFLFGTLKKGKIENRDISFRDSSMNTLLHQAVKKENTKFIQELLKNGIDTSLQNSEGKTALDIAVEMRNKKIQKILEEARNNETNY